MDREARTDETGSEGQMPVRWGYLGLAALIFLLTAALMAGLFHAPDLLPGLGGMDRPMAEPTATDRSATTTPSVPTAAPTAPATVQPTISGLEAAPDSAAGVVHLSMTAEVPPDRQIDEVWLWYGTGEGGRMRIMSGPFSSQTAIRLHLDLAQAGLTGTLTTTHALDYWWLVRDTSGETARAGGSVPLGPALQALFSAPAGGAPAGIEPRWIISGTEHVRLHYLPGTAAERDRFEIGALAEDGLERIRSRLQMEFDGHMDVYLVPRVFWQGGAAYGDKVQLISYLDRNYTGVETWSYFTHEGTHALAQDLLQPKEEDGGPDGVLVEGLAVWVSGGHYRHEPLDVWAAVVAASDDYLPLSELREGPFYDYQHETSYLEGASFVKYLVENYGLDRLKELYGLATGRDAHDQALVLRLYGKSYDELEAEWLDYLAGLEPAPDQVAAWDLKVRSFDLMRRYETALDPDARVLPGTPPPEWTSDTFKIFARRAGEPVNIVLETALIAVQERLYGGDVEGARQLLEDIEAVLDTGPGPAATPQAGPAATPQAGSAAEPPTGPAAALEAGAAPPSLQARWEIVGLLAAQDHAILRADAEAYAGTLDPGSALGREEAVREVLRQPYVTYHQEIVRLDLSGGGDHAEGMVLLHARLAGEGSPVAAPGDGELLRVLLVRTADGWRLVDREPVAVALSLPALGAD